MATLVMEKSKRGRLCSINPLRKLGARLWDLMRAELLDPVSLKVMAPILLLYSFSRITSLPQKALAYQLGLTY